MGSNDLDSRMFLDNDEKLSTVFGEPLSKEEIKQTLQQRFLTPKPAFPKQWLNKCQQQLPREPDLSTLVDIETSQPRTKLQPIRHGAEGKIVGYKEVMVMGTLNAKNSMSLQRNPANIKDFVRGRGGFFPFTPGGLYSDVITEQVDDTANLMEFDDDALLTIPPGFERGLIFDDMHDTSQRASTYVLNITDMMKIDEQDEFGDFAEENINIGVSEGIKIERTELSEPAEHTISQDNTPKDIDELIPNQSTDILMAVVPKPKEISGEKKRDWAHIVDVQDPFIDFYEKVPDMAFKHPFELDTFQKQAVYHLELGESVFVAAHTSAGKTVVAEYAIALAQKHMTRAIYTSPIKALSNQKFRDFREIFPEVGILTGDVQIKPDAPCLIMTTEILKSMLYRGADLTRDVEFVIFDEVHYVNDIERGVVWEEVIIMLPAHVNLILLSATVPNTYEFANWVGRTKKKDIYVISTLKRPVPLEHYLYANKEIYKIVDEKKNFLQNGWNAANDSLLSKRDKDLKAAGNSTRGGRGRGSGYSGGRGRGGSNYHKMQAIDRNLYVHLIGFLSKKNLLPVVIFTFSKKKCEEYASGLTSIDLNNNAEKSAIHIFLKESLLMLQEEDRDLPQILRTKEMLSRGIAVHHSGVLPIVREMVEILFAKGLIKVLFATETFAMGVNMPAKAVVFSHTRKHDGQSFRELLPGEYTQMSGRAGRRGKDATGTVIIACNGDEAPNFTSLNNMILGEPTKLKSQFRLTYAMILNLLRIETIKIEEMIKGSFSEHTGQSLLPTHQQIYLENDQKLMSLPNFHCAICSPDIEQFYEASANVFDLNRKMMEKIVKMPIALKVLGNGRVVIINTSFHRNAAAILLKSLSPQSYVALILVDRRKDGDLQTDTFPLPATRVAVPDTDTATYEIQNINYIDIFMATRTIIKVDYAAITNGKMEITRATQELLRYAVGTQQNGIIENDWSKLKMMDFQELLKEKIALLGRISKFQCTRCPDLNEHYGIIHERFILKKTIDELKFKLSDQNLELLPDYNQRISVLKELNYIDANSTVQLKGRVACEVNSADELILTELIFENALVDFEAEEIVALLSCFVFQEKHTYEPVLTPKLLKGKDIILKIATRVANIQRSYGLDVTPEDYFYKLKFGLVEVVYEWARGMQFKHITELTDVLEGSIVRCITRLDEVLREVRGAAKIVGDSSLHTKIEEAGEKIKRNIVFAASLYFK